MVVRVAAGHHDARGKGDAARELEQLLVGACHPVDAGERREVQVAARYLGTRVVPAGWPRCE